MAEDLAEKRLKAKRLLAKKLLSQGEPSDKSFVDRVSEVASGVNQGLATLAGLPVDAISGALKFAGVDTGTPIGGTENLSNVLRDTGLTFESTDRTGRILQRTGQEIGTTLIPGLGIVGAAGKGAKAAGVLGPAIQAAANNPAKFLAGDIGLSAVSGAAAGGAREAFPDSPAAEITAQLAPSLAIPAAAGGIRRAFTPTDKGRKRFQDTVKTFRDAGTTPSVGQATGNVAFQGFENVIGRSPGGVTPILRATERTQEQIGKRVANIANRLSTKEGAETAGNIIKQGVDKFASRFSARSEKLFGRVRELVPPGSQIQVSRTQETLSDFTKILDEAPKTSGSLVNPKIAAIQADLSADLKGGDSLPYEVVDGLRRQVGRLLGSSEIISQAPRAELKRIYGALTEDLKAGASKAGPGAKAAFEQANRFYSRNIQLVDDQLQKIINKGDPEKIFNAATRGAEGSSFILSARKALTDGEWNVVASNVIRRMGRATAGKQDDLGDVFSSETFLTNWNKLQPLSKKALFGGARFAGLRKDLDTVASAAAQVRQSSRVLSNPSGTAGQAANIAALTSGATAALINPSIALTIGGLVATANASAKLMTSPKFVSWLAKSTKLPLERLPAHIARLSNIASREDVDTQEAIQQYLEILKVGNQSGE